MTRSRTGRHRARGAPVRARHGRTHPIGKALKGRRRAFPLQVVDRFEERHVPAQVCERTKEQRLLAIAIERTCERAGAGGVDAPRAPVGGNRLQMAVPQEHGRGRFRAPALQSRIAVGGITHERQVVGNRGGRHAILRNHRGFVQRRAGPPIELYDTCAAHALGEVLVGRADHNAIDVWIVRGRAGCRRERIIGLELHHRPDGDAERGERLFEQRELREQIGVNPGARLVSGPQPVPEGFDHVIGRDPEVVGALANQGENRCDHGTYCPNLAAVAVASGRDRIIMPKQLVGAVDDVDVHASGYFEDAHSAYLRASTVYGSARTGVTRRRSIASVCFNVGYRVWAEHPRSQRMLVILLLALALPRPADARLQPTGGDSLPRLEMGNFLPAIREQLQHAYAAADAQPGDPEAAGALGMVLDAYEQYDAAALCYRRAQLLDSESFRWRFYLGWVQAAQGRHEDAVRTLADALRMHPGYVPAQLKLAESLLAIGKLQESGEVYHAVTTAHPESADAHYGMGRVSAARGDATAAAAAYLRSVELFPAY